MTTKEIASFEYNVNIICHHDGWILNRMGERLKSELEFVSLYPASDYPELKRSGVLDRVNSINYYINYVLFTEKSHGIDAAFFTHIETDERNLALKDKFFLVASQVDLSVFMAPQYMNQCRNMAKYSTLIVPGVEERFKCRLKLGIVGRDYSYTSRKNMVFFEYLKKIEWIDIEFTNGMIQEELLPDFYQRQDYILVVSTVEGGPMSVIESLAVGKEVIFPRGVGFGELFSDGLILYERDCFDSLILILKRLYRKKKDIAQMVEDLTWQRFAADHKKAFDSLYTLLRK